MADNGYELKKDAASLEYLIQPKLSNGKYGGSLAGRSEAFAECFASLYGDACNNQADIAKWFPESRKVIESVVQVKPSATSARKPHKSKSGKSKGDTMIRLEGPGGIIGDCWGD